jgi:hypothetical protein
MLCALTTPSAEERTDLGAIDPLIVWINFMDEVDTSACAGCAIVQSERIEAKIMSLERIV